MLRAAARPDRAVRKLHGVVAIVGLNLVVPLEAVPVALAAATRVEDQHTEPLPETGRQQPAERVRVRSEAGDEDKGRTVTAAVQVVQADSVRLEKTIPAHSRARYSSRIMRLSVFPAKLVGNVSQTTISRSR